MMKCIKKSITRLLRLSMIMYLSSVYSNALADNIKITDLQKKQVSESEAGSKSEPETQSKPNTIVNNSLKQAILYQSQQLSPEAALAVALTAQKNCRDSGYQVSVAVVDAGGHLQVLLRDKLASIDSPDIAIDKARTAISYQTATSTLQNAVSKSAKLESVKHRPGTLFLSGAVPISHSGKIIAAIGVSGASDVKFDERCALIGIKAIEHRLKISK